MPWTVIKGWFLPPRNISGTAFALLQGLVGSRGKVSPLWSSSCSCFYLTGVFPVSVNNGKRAQFIIHCITLSLILIKSFAFTSVKPILRNYVN